MVVDRFETEEDKVHAKDSVIVESVKERTTSNKRIIGEGLHHES